jgi:hypothetical protein
MIQKKTTHVSIHITEDSGSYKKEFTEEEENGYVVIIQGSDDNMCRYPFLAL